MDSELPVKHAIPVSFPGVNFVNRAIDKANRVLTEWHEQFFPRVYGHQAVPIQTQQPELRHVARRRQ